MRKNPKIDTFRVYRLVKLLQFPTFALRNDQKECADAIAPRCGTTHPEFGYYAAANEWTRRARRKLQHERDFS